MVECHFLIPLRRDAEIADGEPHDLKDWDWLELQIQHLFGFWTVAPGYYHGAWMSPRTGQLITDQSRRFILALPENDIDSLRNLLKLVCRVFPQQCVYLAIAGKVEFVEPENYGQEF